MKKVSTAVLAAILAVLSFAPASASFVLPVATASNQLEAQPGTSIEELKEGNLSSLSAEQILSLTPKSYQEMTGKKMSFKQKVVLRYVQRNMKRDLKKEGSVNVKDYYEEGDRRFNLGGFALGLLLGLIGVALAHIFSNDKSFRRSSWYGIGVLLILAVIIGVAGGGN